MIDRLGICCIINELRDQNIFTGRTLIRRTFSMHKASELALQNARDLITLLQWCVTNQVSVFRVGSDFFPRMTDINYCVDDLEHAIEIKDCFARAGELAFKNGIILSCHPGPFTLIASPRDEVNAGGIKEILMHDTIGNLLNKNADIDFQINFHINSNYDNYEETAARFITNFNSLPLSVRSKIVLENDDRKNGWSVQRLYTLITKHTNIPICFDAHHWLFCHDNATMEDDYNLAKSTWNNRCMQVHYSQSPTADKLVPAHSDFYRDPMPNFMWKNENSQIHLEAKAKEAALFNYRQLFSKEHV